MLPGTSFAFEMNNSIRYSGKQSDELFVISTGESVFNYHLRFLCQKLTDNSIQAIHLHLWIQFRRIQRIF